MRSRVRLVAVGIVLAQLRHAPPLGAACNVVPLELATFSSTHGATTRPFAAPGEPMEIRRRPCDGPGGFLGAPSQHVVTIAFTPPDGGPSSLVMLSTDCTQVDEGSCGPSAVCHEVPTSSIALPGPGRLVFQFPNTDVEFVPDLDQRTLSGPAAIAVTPTAASLPCGLPAGCASVQGMLGADLLACVDDFFEDDGDCGTATPHPTFSHFTALPIPNSYNLDCFSEVPPCNPLATEVRFAVDAAGNLLQPVNWQGVLVVTHFESGDGIRGKFKMSHYRRPPDADGPARRAAAARTHEVAHRAPDSRRGVPRLVLARGAPPATDPRAADRPDASGTRPDAVRIDRRPVHDHPLRARTRNVRRRRERRPTV